jgi:steroid delta-isomerase-like uncharacterized protein
VSTTGITALIASSARDAHKLSPQGPAAARVAELNKRLHQDHIDMQVGATRPASESVRAQRLQEILADYADHAVVEDPMFAEPIVGKSAIARRKLAEMNAMAAVSIEVTNRFAHGDQVVVEWVMRGRHEGDFFGYQPTGREINHRGVTVVTRQRGKIVRETLHYDLAELHRLMSSDSA